MARLLRDCNQVFVIELSRGRTFVHFVIMDNLEVRLRKLPHSRLVRHEQGCAEQAVMFDTRFKPVELPHYPLERAIKHFLEPRFSKVHDNARRALEALQQQKVLSEADMVEDTGAVADPTPKTGDTQEGVDDMAKKAEAVSIEPNLDNYKTTKAASGRKSLDIGDDVAKLLRGKELKDVYEIAAKKLDVSERSLKDKYGHLNAGQQRMNLGNRLRGLAKAKAKKAS